MDVEAWRRRGANWLFGPPGPAGFRHLAAALGAAAAFVGVLCTFFAPRWETNDDVAMSMIAHGYGSAAHGSPNILFSNVVWGHVVRAIPSIDGTLGYSIATLGVLVLAGAAIAFAAYRLGAGRLGALGALVLLLARPVLLPQFTLNAGLLAVGALLCLHVFARDDDRRALGFGAVLALLGFLIRREEFILVALVALPLIPWRSLWHRRAIHLTGVALMSAMALFTWVDQRAYAGPEWKAFRELNLVRAAFTDFGVGEHLKRRPDILARHGYSANDVDLLTAFFFVDTRIADPQRMQAMMGELGPLPAQGDPLVKGRRGVKALIHPFTTLLLAAAALIGLLRPSWRVAAAWALTAGIAFLLGVLGRPDTVRVYVPLLSLLVLAPFLVGQVSAWRQRLAISVLAAVAAVNVIQVTSQSRDIQRDAEGIRASLADLPNEPVVVWAGALPFESAYPVLSTPPTLLARRFYNLGVSTHAPTTVAFAEQRAGRGLLDRLVQPSGVPIIARPTSLVLLKRYCAENGHGDFAVLSSRYHGGIEVQRCRCGSRLAE